MSHQTVEASGKQPKLIDELSLTSISVYPGPAKLTQILTGGKLFGNPIKGFQVAMDPVNPINPEGFVLLIASAFSLRTSADPTLISFDQSTPSETDQDFARKFGYEAKPLAVVRVNSRGFLEVWIGPTLLPEDHPLAFSRRANHLHVETGRGAVLQDWTSHVLAPERQIVTAYYLGVTVTDQEMVLANVAGKIGDQGINVHSLEQIKSPDKTAELGLLLDPCETERMHCAVRAIRRLPTTVAVTAIYRVLGDPSRKVG